MTVYFDEIKRQLSVFLYSSTQFISLADLVYGTTKEDDKQK